MGKQRTRRAWQSFLIEAQGSGLISSRLLAFLVSWWRICSTGVTLEILHGRGDRSAFRCHNRSPDEVARIRSPVVRCFGLVMMPDSATLLKLVFSPAQLVGYLAFVFGVYSFAQTDDRRLKAAVALQSLSYALHFTLLGRQTAALASLITMTRSLLSLRTRSRWILAAILAANVTLGLTLAHGAVAWLPVAGSCLGSVAFFLLSGIEMRMVMLGGTALWLCNAVLTGSIGSTLLELTIGGVNVTTIWRLRCARKVNR